jgi:hypothetical protein
MGGSNEGHPIFKPPQMSITTTKVDLYCCLVSNTKDSTLSRLWMRTTFSDASNANVGIGWILEDGMREKGKKVYGKTCIWEGSYPVEPVFAPSKFAIMAQKDWGHAFAIGIAEVKDFDKIRCHWGVKVEDSLGCPLIGGGVGYNDTTHCFTLTNSRDTYRLKLYPRLAPYFDLKTQKFTVPITWHALRNNLLDVNLKYMGL